MPHNYHRLVWQTLAAMALGLVAIGAFVYTVDPYQQYHKHNRYCGDQRLEIGGVARHHDYNAFITGSSMAMNHFPEQADSLWGWRTRNFSIMGATDDDYATMLPFILSRGKTRNVILALDYFSFARQRGAVNPYLYDDNRLNDYEYLWNYTSLNKAIDLLRHGGLPEKNLYHFANEENPTHSRQSLRTEFLAQCGPQTNKAEFFDMPQMAQRFDESILKIVRDNPDVTWYIYFPPYSVMEFVVQQEHGDLNNVLSLKRHMIATLQPLPNVRLYDFQCSPWIDNLDQYMDTRHHSVGYNKAIISAIHADSCRVRSARYDDRKLRALTMQYTDSLR